MDMNRLKEMKQTEEARTDNAAACPMGQAVTLPLGRITKKRRILYTTLALGFASSSRQNRFGSTFERT
jgi:hypothetical protein